MLRGKERIRLEYSNLTSFEWTFAPGEGGTTLVSIADYGFIGDGEEFVKHVSDLGRPVRACARRFAILIEQFSRFPRCGNGEMR